MKSATTSVADPTLEGVEDHNTVTEMMHFKSNFDNHYEDLNRRIAALDAGEQPMCQQHRARLQLYHHAKYGLQHVKSAKNMSASCSSISTCYANLGLFYLIDLLNCMQHAASR